MNVSRADLRNRGERTSGRDIGSIPSSPYKFNKFENNYLREEMTELRVGIPHCVDELT